MTDAELSARMRANITAFKHLQAAHTPLRHLALPGVDAFALAPRLGSLHQQQVLYTSVSALADALGALEDFYRGHGVPAWRVAVSGRDTEAPRLLARAGYRAEDAIPVMGLALEEAPLQPPARALVRPATLEALVAVNVESFGVPMGYLDAWRGSRVEAPLHVLEAHEDGRALAAAMALDAGDTAGIYLVATATAARRRGLASEVMRGLLLEARARGRAAAVLQTTEMGHGVYLRLGFRDVDRWTNWVRRPSP